MSCKSMQNVLVAVASFAAFAIADAPNAAAAEPFKATLTGNAHPDFTHFPVVTNEETGVGEATHLGRFIWEDEEVAVFAPDGTFTVEGTFTMTAANGDQIFGEFTTTGYINGDGNLVIHGNYENRERHATVQRQIFVVADFAAEMGVFATAGRIDNFFDLQSAHADLKAIKFLLVRLAHDAQAIRRESQQRHAQDHPHGLVREVHRFAFTLGCDVLVR